MPGRFALDTNILVYAMAKSDDARHAAAVDILARALALEAVVPLQVLGEFLNACRRKRIAAMDQALARVVEWLPLLHCPRTEIDDLVAGAEASGKHQLEYFDALIAIVARNAGAEHLLSEDMQDGFQLDGLTVINPFKSANQAIVKELLQ